jgi:hypothetical protein
MRLSSRCAMLCSFASLCALNACAGSQTNPIIGGGASPTPSIAATPAASASQTAAATTTPVTTASPVVTATPSPATTATPTATPTPTPKPTFTATPSAAATGPLLYVDGAVTAAAGTAANVGGIGAYSLSSNGNASAIRLITGVHTGLPQQTAGLLSPGPMAFDGSGRVYVIYPWGDSIGEIAAFAPTASGDATPSRYLDSYNLRDAWALAVDAGGAVFAAANFYQKGISIYANTANDMTPPLGVIAGTVTTASGTGPQSLATAKDGSLVAFLSALSPPPALSGFTVSIVTYGPHPTPASVPLRTIAGPHTGIGVDDGETNYVLAVAPATGETYALITSWINAFPGRIDVYAPSANGDVAPTRVITGPATGLGNSYIRSIAVDATGRIYVINPVGTAILVFAADANGNAAPIATIHPSELSYVSALAISP